MSVWQTNLAHHEWPESLREQGLILTAVPFEDISHRKTPKSQRSGGRIRVLVSFERHKWLLQAITSSKNLTSLGVRGRSSQYIINPSGQTILFAFLSLIILRSCSRNVRWQLCPLESVACVLD